MLRRDFLFHVVLPLVMLEGYLVSVWLIPPTRDGALFAENGVFELGTAAFFCAAGCLALDLGVRTHGFMPKRYRAMLLLVALAAWFVALEEISYGQHLCGWVTPAWFVRHNGKSEINLHNLYGSGVSNVMRDAANLGFPIAFLVVPLIAMLRSNAYKPGRWSYYLLPRTELVTLILVAQSLTLLHDLSKWTVGSGLFVRPGEVQEFFWAMAAAMYVVVLRQRLLPARSQGTSADVRTLQLETRELRRAA